MKADEMFEKLGHAKVEEDKNRARYTKQFEDHEDHFYDLDNNVVTDEIFIGVDTESKEFGVWRQRYLPWCDDDGYPTYDSAYVLTITEMQAVIAKIEEMKEEQ